MAFRRTFLAAALAAAFIAPIASAQQYSGVVTFGDSLSDGGTYGSKFTTNPSNVWVETLAERLGLTLTPWTKGGTNYAQGGARVSQTPGITPAGAPERPISVQITQYLAANGGAVNPNALITIQGGPNDIFVGLEAASKGVITPAQLQAAVQQAAGDFITQIARLQKAGAGTILVANIPDIGLTPLGLANNGANKATFTGLSSLFNTLVNEGLRQLGGNVVAINTFGMIREVTANPGAFGFTNVTVPACKTASAITCGPTDLREAGANKTYFFADSVHPTTSGGEIVANIAAATLAAPSQMSLLPEAALNGSRFQTRVLEQRARTTQMGGATGLFLNLDFGKTGVESGTDFKSTGFTIGLDKKVGAFTAGMAIGINTTKSDLLGVGSFHLEQPTLNIFGSGNFGAVYVGANVFAGDLRFQQITRPIQIGTATRNEISSTGGSQLGLGLTGGMWFNAGAIQHGPYARLDYSEVKVKAFAEPGTSSTALAFGKQRREQLLGAIGWQAAGTFGMFSPYARVAYEQDFQADARAVHASVVSMDGAGFNGRGITPNERQILIEAGVAAKFAGAELGLSVAGGAGRNNGNYSSVNLGLRVPL
jgi:outer membrane lipase/esterase